MRAPICWEMKGTLCKTMTAITRRWKAVVVGDRRFTRLAEGDRCHVILPTGDDCLETHIALRESEIG